MTVRVLRISPLFLSLIAVIAALPGSTALAQALNPFDEMAKATNWPNGANYQNEGSFRAWSSIPNDPVLDLSKLKGIDDIVQVHVHRDGWVVLRKNGQTISSDGKADRENIKRIFRGVFNWFGFISNEGGIIGFGSNGQLNENEIPSDLGPVKDAYMGVHNRVALLEDGSIRVWGKAFDGIKLEKGNLEWPEKPSLPPGKKAVAISCSDWLVAIKTDDGSLHLFSYFHGEIPMPPEFGTGKIGAFCVNRAWVFGISKESGKGLQMHIEKEGLTTVAGFPRGENAIALLNTESGAALLNTGGRLTVNNGNFGAVPGLKDSLPWVKNPRSDLISVSVAYRKPPLIGRILWFKGETGPSASAPKTVTSVKNPVKPPMPSQVVKKSATEVIPKTPATQVPAIPELRSRIVTYQTARRDQLSKLALKYGKALNAADQTARNSGNLDQVEAVRAALQQVSDFKALFSGLPKSLDVTPLPDLPPLAVNTPDSVKRLRPIFDAEKLKIETANYTLLEASLNTLQIAQVKVRKMKEARELEAYRAKLAKVFAKVKTSVAVAAVKKSPTAPAPARPEKKMPEKMPSSEKSILYSAEVIGGEHTIEAGHYDLNSGRAHFGKESRTESQKKIAKITIGKGADIRNGEVLVGLGRLDAKEVRFERLSLNAEVARLTFEECLFQETTLEKVGGWHFAFYSSKFIFNNCVFSKSFFKGIDFGGEGFEIRACTFLDIDLSPIAFKDDASKEALDKFRTIEDCLFIKCKVPESFLICTKDCVFIDCEFLPLEDFVAKSPIKVRLRASSAVEPPAGKNRTFLVKDAKGLIGTQGASVRYSYEDGKLEFD